MDHADATGSCDLRTLVHAGDHTTVAKHDLSAYLGRVERVREAARRICWGYAGGSGVLGVDEG